MFCIAELSREESKESKSGAKANSRNGGNEYIRASGMTARNKAKCNRAAGRQGRRPERELKRELKQLMMVAAFYIRR